MTFHSYSRVVRNSQLEVDMGYALQGEEKRRMQPDELTCRDRQRCAKACPTQLIKGDFVSVQSWRGWLLVYARESRAIVPGWLKLTMLARKQLDAGGCGLEVTTPKVRIYRCCTSRHKYCHTMATFLMNEAAGTPHMSDYGCGSCTMCHYPTDGLP
jgi:hypothetical protein